MDPQSNTGAGARAYAAVDLGASSGRVVLGAAEDGRWSFEEIHRFENGVRRSGAGDVWDLERLFAETVVGLRRAAEHCDRAGRRLAGIGVDSWGVDWALLAADGAVELPVSSYRSAPDPEPVLASRALGAREAYETSGLPDLAINSGLRLAAQAVDRDFAGEQVLFIPDLWVFWLTGERGTDPTIASTSQLLDVRSGEFSATMLGALGLQGLSMPRVRPVGSRAGMLTEPIRARIGVDSEVPVFRVAGHDTAAAFAFADPAGAEGIEALVSSGTWSLVGAAAPQPITTPEAERLGFSNERGADGVLLLRNLTGLWMLQECVREWESSPDRPVLEDLLAEVEHRDFDPRTFDTSAPGLLGSGGMETRIRALCAQAGRPLDASRASVVHAVLDSLAAAYASGVRAAQRLLGEPVRRVRIVGGGSRNTRLCRLTAELLEMPVLAGPTEASAIGNIAIQAAADGAVAHPAEVFAALHPQETRSYTPRTERPAEENRA